MVTIFFKIKSLKIYFMNTFKKLIILFVILLGINTFSYSQWEFQYFVLKAGVNHHMFSPQPDTVNNFFMKTPYGEMRAIPTKQFSDYIPGFNVDLHFHLDFQNDKGGIVAGIQYFNYGISSKYANFDTLYTLIASHRVYGIGIPFIIKFGNEIFNDQKYFFAGVQYNINLSMQKIETVNWSAIPKKVMVKNTEFIKGQPVFLFGFNYMIFNIELNFMPKNFINQDFGVSVGPEGKEVVVRPYTGQPDKLFYLKTSLNIPLSPWTTKKNYTLHKIVKRLKFWR